MLRVRSIVTLARRWCYGRRYSEQHEWVQRSKGESDNLATVGISQYAADALGDVVFAQLPSSGTKVSQGGECGALESVKAASELYAPVSGEVTEPNTAVESQPALINTSCLQDGWLFKLRLSNPSEIDSLMTEEQYQEFLKKDTH